ncbi:MAG TPA: hypothetical protein VMP01_15010 [Pirellulaceae bacterium]|nr:hypothetical protein [Pirellulaceae bacterium]
MEGIAGNAFFVLAQVGPTSSPGTSKLPLLDLPAVALCIGAIALVLLAAMIVSGLLSASARRETNHPRRLLCELCEAHGFRRRQQRALISAATTLGVQQPARFFLERSLLDQAAGHPKLSARRSDLLEIAGELFGPTEKV